MPQIKTIIQTCEKCGEPIKPIMKIYPRKCHVKKAIEKASNEIRKQELMAYHDKGLTVNYDELEEKKYAHLGKLYYCENCKIISNLIR